MSKIITLSKLKTALEPLIALIGKKAEKPNWNENNPESASYIANRPFYSEVSNTVLADNVTIEIVKGPVINPFTMDEIVEGLTYKVVLNGIEYECVAYIAEGPNTPSIGNGEIGGASGGNGEPFFITIFNGDLMVFADSGTYTLSILTTSEKVVKIPAEYLPEIEMAKPDWNSNDENSSSYIKNRTHYYGEKIFNSTWIDNVTFTGFSNGRKVLSVSEVQSIPKLKEHKGWNYNSLYTVIWDGVEYPNIAVSGRSGEPGLSMHDGNINIRFDGRLKIYCYNDDVSESHTISVYEYTDTVTLTGTINGLEQYNTIDFPEMEFPPFFDGETYYVEYTLFNQHIACQGKANDGALYFDEYYRISTGDGGIVNLDSIHGSNCSWSPSSVTLYSSDKLPEYQETLAITFSRGTKPLDETFIPNTIARLEQIPAIDTTLSIEGAAADAKAVNRSINERMAEAKDYIPLIDHVNGYTYLVSMRNGNLVSQAGTKSIEVTTMPTTTAYMNGAYFDATGMIVTATCYDGTTKEIADYTCTSTALAEGTTSVKVSYIEAGVTYTANVPVTVSAFDPAVALIDFTYTDNGNGTYTITGWNGTYNGATSTEMIIPNYGCIIV